MIFKNGKVFTENGIFENKDVVIEGKNGYNVCPKPTSMGGDGAKTTTFKNKQFISYKSNERKRFCS